MNPSFKERLNALPPEKRKVLLEQLKKKREQLQKQIQPQPRQGQPFPLSYAQERMWFLYQLDPTSPMYNVSVTVCLTGLLNIPLLEQSINVLIKRHEALRTTFKMVNGQPMQFITNATYHPLPVIDLCSQTDPEAKFYHLAQLALLQPFNLKQNPLMRVELYCLTDTEAYLMITMHHIISDGWSVGILARELATVYTALYNKQPINLPELTVQCVDFAVWQREWLQGERLDSLLSYWQKHLANAPRLLQLPTDYTQPLEPTSRGARVSFKLDDDLYYQLKELSRKQGYTLFMVLFAGFAILLFRLSGQKDIVVGTPITNRSHQQVMGIVGVFVNILALRLKLNSTLSYRQLLQQIQQVVLDGFDNQAMPFAKLIDSLKIDRVLNRSPLFQISFGVQENPLQTMEMPNLTAELLEVKSVLQKGVLPPLHTGMAMFDLTFHLSEITEGAGGWIEYSTDLFKEATILRLAKQYHILLSNIVANLDEPISTLPLLTALEKQQLLVTWNKTEQPLPKQLCLHTLFEAQAKKTPTHIAIEMWQDLNGNQITLTYHQLNTQAEQLAAYLRTNGVTTETMVGVCLNRSTAMIVAILGILKAGGIYVPLSPTYPPNRLAYMMTDSGISILLSQESLLEHLPDYNGQIICLDKDNLPTISTPLNPVSVSPDNAAYMIYTSGSTGKPKGVLVTHKSACNLVLAQIKNFALQTDSRSLQFASMSFDAAISEVFTTLIAGATLVLAPSPLLVPGDEFTTLLTEAKITTITLPPSALSVMDGNKLPLLKTLISAGEACQWEMVERWAEGRRFLNFYGPTEGTVGSCYHLVTEQLEGPLTVPIGKPINNVKLYVIDANMQPLPPGIAGQLAISGIGLARGYFNKPAQTATKFVPNPFSQTPGSRLYLSGDLVRYWPDGYLEFLGRIDYQVKLRGYRIELGEIEASLKQHEAINETVVMAREDTPGHKQLVAYFKEPPNNGVTLQSLRQFLSSQLPDYMVPAVFMPLESWPLTANGKIDRQALPKPDQSRLQSEQLFEAASNEIEEILMTIWKQVLTMETISVHDNFFELGGDSIMSIQMVARAREMGIYLTPRQIFLHQNISKLARIATVAPSVQAESGLVTGKVPLTPIQHWFFEQSLPELHHWNQAILLTVQDPLNLALLQQVALLLLEHHDGLRLRFNQQANQWEQVNTEPDGTAPVTCINLSTMPADEQQTALESQATVVQASLDLSEGPLLRLVYFDFGPNKSGRLLFVAHHLVIDAVSWPILIQDFQTAYQQLKNGEKPVLPAKTTSFKQWAERLAEYAHHTTVQETATYWLKQANKPIKKMLPLDFTNELDNNIEAMRSEFKCSLDSEMTHALLRDVPPVYNTQINDVLLTALAQVYTEWTQNGQMLIDLESHGREPLFDDIDLSRTVGWFTSLYPVCLNIAGIKDPGQALKTVKEQLRAVPSNGLNYGLLRYLSDDKPLQNQLATSPKAPISFNYLGQIATKELLPLATEPVGPLHSLKAPCQHLLEIEAQIMDEQLTVTWLYSRAIHNPKTIARLAQRYIEQLHELITHCQTPQAGGYTPSDFPEADLNEDGLENIFMELDGLFD